MKEAELERPTLQNVSRITYAQFGLSMLGAITFYCDLSTAVKVVRRINKGQPNFIQRSN